MCILDVYRVVHMGKLDNLKIFFDEIKQDLKQKVKRTSNKVTLYAFETPEQRRQHIAEDNVLGIQRLQRDIKIARAKALSSIAGLSPKESISMFNAIKKYEKSLPEGVISSSQLDFYESQGRYACSRRELEKMSTGVAKKQMAHLGVYADYQKQFTESNIKIMPIETERRTEYAKYESAFYKEEQKKYKKSNNGFL